MKTYIQYARRSTAKQETSLFYQHAFIESHPITSRMKCLGKYDDVISGTKVVGRDNLDNIYKYCKKNPSKVDYLVVQKFDRLGRNLADTATLIKRFQIIGVEVNAVEQWIDYRAMSAYTMLGIYLGRAEDEHHEISDRTKSALYYLKTQGYYITSLPPKGYTKINEEGTKRKILFPSQPEFGIIQYCLSNLEKYTIAALMDKYARRLGLSRNSFYALFKKEVYADHFMVPPFKNYPGMLVKSRHQGAITYDQFLANQEISKNRNRLFGITRINKNKYWLKDHLYCKLTGKRMSASASTSKTGKKHHYYHNSIQNGQRIKVDLAHSIVEQVIKALVIRKQYLHYLKKEVKSQRDLILKKLRKEINSITTRLSEIEKGTKNLMRLVANEDIDVKEYKEIKAELELEKSQLNVKLIDKKKKIKNNDEKVITGVKELSKVYHVFKQTTVGYKDEILKCLFPMGFFIDLELGKVGTQYINSFILKVVDIQRLRSKIKVVDSLPESQPPFRVEDGI